MILRFPSSHFKSEWGYVSQTDNVASKIDSFKKEGKEKIMNNAEATCNPDCNDHLV